MSNLERLAANIRSLRKAYGETQEDLGMVLNIEKNTVSSYENAKREPNKDILTEIAKHYMISVDELICSDLSDIGSIKVDNKVILKNIGTILPIVISEEALNNEHFKKAHYAHRNLYDELCTTSMDGIDCIDVCLEEYFAAYEEDKIKPETAANIMAIWNLMFMIVKVAPMAIKNRTAVLMQIATKDPKVRAIIDNTNLDFEKDVKGLADGLSAPEIIEMVNEMMTTIKHSNWSDLADYYLALQYILNNADNDLGWDFNRRIGIEMLKSFMSVNNIYAEQYIKFSLDSVGQSSQIVDDK